jgi:hypothetical protein
MSSYDDYKAEIKEAQKDKSYSEIKQDMQKQAVDTVDLNNMPSQEHHWVDRGLVLSCEGGSHPNHRSFKRQR